MLNTQLLYAILPIVLPLAAPFLVALYRRLVEGLPTAKRRAVEQVVNSAVPAAEQIYAAIPGSGKAKKLWVEAQVKAILGTRLNPALVDIFIEEAVAMINADKQTSAESQSSMGFTPIAAPQPIPATVPAL